jgi:membrane protein implicated in regulation of membrane protease activity
MLTLLKSIFLGLNELVTLGGASAARDAHQALSEELGRYQSYYGRAESQQKELEEHITSIGEKLTAAQKTLKKAEKLIQRNFTIQHHSWQAPDRSMFEDIRKFKNNIHRSLTGRRLMNFAGIGIGASSGGALSVGSWALVASLGSASTGTAISTLAGAAASNATLAWFGGGAIAAGGAGMSGGSVVLGLFATVPVIFFATWLTYRQAKKYEAERQRVIELRQKLEHSFHNLLTSLIVVHKKKLEISAFCDDFQYKTQSLFKELEPKGFVNMLKRRMPWLALKNNSSPASVEARKKLEHFTIDFLKRLAVNKFI